MRHGEVKGNVQTVIEELKPRGYSPVGIIAGYFVIQVQGRELGKGSGIAGDHRWFYCDTKQTANWRDFPNKHK